MDPQFTSGRLKRRTAIVVLSIIAVSICIASAWVSYREIERQTALGERRSATPPLIDIPGLAFANRDAVNKALGKPLKIERDGNLTNWKEADILQVTYRRAICGFLDERLVNINYRFDGRLSTAADLLAASGFPESAVAIDTDGHLPFGAMLKPYGNPIRYHGVVYYSVLFGEDLSAIDVVIASVNDHFSEWPEGTRRAWLDAGGPNLSSSILDRPIRPRAKRPAH